MIDHGQQQGIGYFEGVFTPQLCDAVIEQFCQSDKRQVGAVFSPDGKQVDSEDKVSVDLDVTEDFPEQLRDQIHQSVSLAFNEFQDKFPSLKGREFKTSGYRIQLYKKDEGKFVWHSDATTLASYQRQVAMVLYLNHVEVGGLTEFHYQDVRVSPRQGSCVFFPPFWTHMHRGTIPKSNDKIVLTTFFERIFPGDTDVAYPVKRAEEE